MHYHAKQHLGHGAVERDLGVRTSPRAGRSLYTHHSDDREGMKVGLKVGQRLKSMVCSTEIMVITAPDGEIQLTCGGAQMTDGEGNGEGGSVHPDHASGSTIGKRYVSKVGDLEILCVKPGEGSLAVGDVALNLKDAKKLPKTD